MNTLILLAAIAIVESGDIKHPEIPPNDKAIGAKGEVSRYQILPSTWIAMGGKDLKYAKNYLISEEIAENNLEDIRRRLKPKDKNNVRIIAACWKYGVVGYKRRGLDGLSIKGKKYTRDVEAQYKRLSQTATIICYKEKCK